MDKPNSSEVPPEDSYTDPHTFINEETGEITFDRTHPFYIMERDAFRAKGYDIEKVRTFREYMDIHMQCVRLLMELQDARILNSKGTDLRTRRLKAAWRGDFEEHKRLVDLEKKKERLGLKAI